MKTCNRCQENIDSGQIACPYCGGELNVAENHAETEAIESSCLIKHIIKYSGFSIFILSIAVTIWLGDIYNEYPIIYDAGTLETSLKVPLAALSVVLLVVGIPIILTFMTPAKAGLTIYSIIAIPMLYSSVRDYSNIALDKSSAIHITAKVLSKKEVHEWKTYNYQIDLKTSAYNSVQRIGVSKESFDKIAVNDSFSLKIKPGFWGKRWVVRYVKI